MKSGKLRDISLKKRTNSSIRGREILTQNGSNSKNTGSYIFDSIFIRLSLSGECQHRSSSTPTHTVCKRLTEHWWYIGPSWDNVRLHHHGYFFSPFKTNPLIKQMFSPAPFTLKWISSCVKAKFTKNDVISHPLDVKSILMMKVDCSSASRHLCLGQNAAFELIVRTIANEGQWGPTGANAEGCTDNTRATDAFKFGPQEREMEALVKTSPSFYIKLDADLPLILTKCLTYPKMR